MSNTTASQIPSSDVLFLIFKNSKSVIDIYFWGYLFLFLFGFLGNVANLLTFTRPTLRNLSTGILFLLLAISDTVYLLVKIIDFVEYGLQVQIYKKVDYGVLCRFRSFADYVSQMNSAWILVLISIDRWIRTRFPFKAASLCTIKTAAIGACVLLVICIGLNSHMLRAIFGTFIPAMASASCGPSLYTNIEYITWYFKEWSILQIFVWCLIPAVLMILTLIDILWNIRIRRQAAFSPNQQQDLRTRNLQKQIFILLISRISIFLATTLPMYLYRIIGPKQLTFSTLTPPLLTAGAILTWVSSLNYTVNFYSFCLTSKFFRDEFLEQMRIVLRRQRRRVTPVFSINTLTNSKNTRINR